MIDDNDAVQIGHLISTLARHVDDSAQKLGAADIKIVGKIVDPLRNLARYRHAQAIVTVEKGLPCHLASPPQNTPSRASCPRAEPS